MKTITLLLSSSGKNKELANTLKDIIEKSGAKGSIINLEVLELPLYSGIEEERSGVPKEVIDLKNKMVISDGFIFIAPEYNGSLPPVLINAISWLSRSSDDWREAFNGKIAAIATHSGGGGKNVLMAMRLQLSFLGTNVLGRELLTNYSKQLNISSAEAVIKEILKLASA